MLGEVCADASSCHVIWLRNEKTPLAVAKVPLLPLIEDGDASGCPPHLTRDGGPSGSSAFVHRGGKTRTAKDVLVLKDKAARDGATPSLIDFRVTARPPPLIDFRGAAARDRTALGRGIDEHVYAQPSLLRVDA